MATLQPRDACGSDGNTDLYGLGNRLGIYFQIIAFIIATKRKGRGVSDDPHGALFSSINVALLATFIAVVKGVVNGTMRTLDLYIIDSLIFTQINLPLLTFDHMFVKHPVATLVVAPLGFAMQALVAWFWYVGIDKLPRTGCPDDYGFFFSKVSLYGWFRTLWKVFSVLTAILAGLVFVSGRLPT